MNTRPFIAVRIPVCTKILLVIGILMVFQYPFRNARGQVQTEPEDDSSFVFERVRAVCTGEDDGSGFKGTSLMNRYYACYFAGMLLSESNSVPRDLDQAMVYYSAACDGGSPPGCSALGDMLSIGNKSSENMKLAAGFYLRACDLGDDGGCYGLGILLRRPDGGIEQQKESFKYLSKAREFREMECNRPISSLAVAIPESDNSIQRFNCWLVGLMYQEGEGGPVEPAKAAFAFQKACPRGELDDSQINFTCSELGIILEGRGPSCFRNSSPQDLAMAKMLYEKACNARRAEGCLNLGRMLERGIGGEEDLNKAEEYYVRAREGFTNSCGDHSRKMSYPASEGSCRHLASMWMDGIGGFQDYLKAGELYLKACDMGDGAACSDYGTACHKGLFGTRDDAKAREFQRKGCDLGNRESCRFLAAMIENGEGGDRDIHKALELYGWACDMLDGESCYNLGLIWVDGRNNLPADPQKALSYFGRACTNYYDRGYFQIGALWESGKAGSIDLTKALHYYVLGCGTDAESCKAVASLLRKKPGCDKDCLSEAEAFDELACECGEKDVCPGVNDKDNEQPSPPNPKIRQTSKNPNTVPTPPTLPEQISNKSCAEKGDRYCDAGKDKDLGQARKEYQKACKANCAEACYKFGLMLISGKGGSKDLKQAKKILKASCDSKYPPSCRKYNELIGSIH